MSRKEQCVKCSKEDRSNQNRLDPLLLPITYESSDIITQFSLPRKYTSSHNDLTKEIYLSIGHKYNKRILSSEEEIKTQSSVIGKWVEVSPNKYEIRLRVAVSTQQNPQAAIRNTIFCRELGTVIEGIAFAETALFSKYPHLLNTPVVVCFKSIDKKYDRVEYWHKIKYWITDNKIPTSD